MFADTPEKHILRLRDVFERLKSAQLKVKVEKCRLMNRRVEFLGHVISDEGVAVDPNKISKVTSWPVPKNLKELRVFLGFCSYYRRFVLEFSNITDSLSQLTRKNERFGWNDERQAAFETLKEKLSTAPILGLPNDDDEYVLDTDASEFAIGAVLSQRQDGREVVLAYGSRLLSRAERNYCTTRRELLAVVYFLKYFKTYLLGRPFCLRTDHAALQWLQRTPDPIGQQARWQERLSEFKFKIIHRPGRSHLNADGMSRRPPSPLEAMVATVTQQANQINDAPCIAVVQRKDPLLERLHEWMTNGAPELDEILTCDEETKAMWHIREQVSIEDDVLYRNRHDGVRQILLPKSMRKEFLRMCHVGMTGGHLGVRRTRAQVRRRAHWFGWSKDTLLYCRSCEQCARYRQGKPPKQAKLQPVLCGAPWEVLSIDVTGPHPKSSKDTSTF